ncbi:formiminoglutamase [Aureibacter tunicatorum]|uniref:Formiminoglutamase n=1 Tax=Aureibacter tunicatorum TaxID=866807 RepID=A0AAE3XKU9_9BACT|nr:formiminoglutamase [Aureibacter tunicatorum]MDR6237780.1 formiminoglutamase [Aureibacter tunicatorum]BDD02815.1 arginase [Aureibacter tunicatorum]
MFEEFCLKPSKVLENDEFDKNDYGRYAISLSRFNGDLNSISLALLSVGSLEYDQSAEKIRAKLYSLKRPSHDVTKVLDLGHLIVPEDVEFVDDFEHILSCLLSHNVLPLILGECESWSFGQYSAYGKMDDLLNFLNVDPVLDISQSLLKVFTQDPNHLFHYTHLAYQSYLSNPDTISLMKSLGCDIMRLGDVSHQIVKCEPLVRDANLLSFNVSAIKAIDFPASNNEFPFGLSGEHSAQLFRYAGISSKLSSIGIYGYQSDKDNKHYHSASVLAVMLWYFIEGFSMRKDSLDFTEKKFLKYNVAIPGGEEDLVFYKNKLDEKWWMEVPVLFQGRDISKHVISCDYGDYESALYGDLPERYINAFARLN